MQKISKFGTWVRGILMEEKGTYDFVY